MTKQIYLIRHCEAEGQPAESPLTSNGHKQAEMLADFFSNLSVDQIISSPYLRAKESVRPLADKKGLSLKVDERLHERILSTKNLPYWLPKLKETFVDLDLAFEGGESSRVATSRAIQVIEETLTEKYNSTLIVTHGNLLSLILKHFDSSFGFKEWKMLTNPDVFRLDFTNNSKPSIKHLW
ncbi:histidine phosphatase family protein [Salinibacillus xinjiangensis]|uniref:Histidine phosphatase family protein n=1 Tax=Salinibacillus xinjiangensis TaxID=1229268 RepID=A0A6G1X5C4_9BACI|nr:histidine phosphatase family protein [Salinibacillus xinjiangensis]MRG86142.1 histidine phosphatase family protein [Salinibacillus xinjiangensis]